MCGGFTCSKNALTALNILYVIVAKILIGVAVYGRASALVTNLPIIGGILACGIILIIISVLGLVGAIKHHQVILFFYMLILFLLFLVQFSVACACLAVNRDQQHQLAERGWKTVDEDLRVKVQQEFGCCSFNQTSKEDYPGCPASCATTPCPSCMEKLQGAINYAFKLCGGIGLFFSFTEVDFLSNGYLEPYYKQNSNRAIRQNFDPTCYFQENCDPVAILYSEQFLGVWLTVRYRNQKDPRANPSAYL